MTFKLPEVFYIHSKNLEEKKIVAEWFNNKYEKGRFSHSAEGEYYTPSINDNYLYGESRKPNNGIPIINFEQFEEYVLFSKKLSTSADDYQWLIPILKKYNIK